MSIDIGWEKITSGPDGAALAEKVRAFVHDKFQQVPLPRFINAVHVHSFEFGSVCPEIEIKDICDPLPDFYDDEDEEEGEDDLDAAEPIPQSGQLAGPQDMSSYQHPNASSQPRPPLPGIITGLGVTGPQSLSAARELAGAGIDPFSGPFPRSTTPGIPGGTSNLSYFHFPTGGLSGTQTPLAAVASGTPFSPRQWGHEPPYNSPAGQHPSAQTKHQAQDQIGHDDPSTRPSTATSISSARGSGSGHPSPQLPESAYPHDARDEFGLDGVAPLTPLRTQSRQPSDLQVVTRVKYSGDVRMTLTAEILLDYPMPSFVGIPLKLAITGLTFDGFSIVAWIKRKMHFCFLESEDAATLVGENVAADHRREKGGKDDPRSSLPGPLREIHVESEIGRQEDGKQVLKNVGKVEKFVLEQVRKIFEEEFVFPSYWTFLL